MFVSSPSSKQFAYALYWLVRKISITSVAIQKNLLCNVKTFCFRDGYLRTSKVFTGQRA
jgi:hypothetical protein